MTDPARKLSFSTALKWQGERVCRNGCPGNRFNQVVEKKTAQWDQRLRRIERRRAAFRRLLKFEPV